MQKFLKVFLLSTVAVLPFVSGMASAEYYEKGTQFPGEVRSQLESEGNIMQSGNGNVVFDYKGHEYELDSAGKILKTKKIFTTDEARIEAYNQHLNEAGQPTTNTVSTRTRSDILAELDKIEAEQSKIAAESQTRYRNINQRYDEIYNERYQRQTQNAAKAYEESKNAPAAETKNNGSKTVAESDDSYVDDSSYERYAAEEESVYSQEKFGDTRAHQEIDMEEGVDLSDYYAKLDGVEIPQTKSPGTESYAPNANDMAKMAQQAEEMGNAYYLTEDQVFEALANDPKLSPNVNLEAGQLHQQLSEMNVGDSIYGADGTKYTLTENGFVKDLANVDPAAAYLVDPKAALQRDGEAAAQFAVQKGVQKLADPTAINTANVTNVIQYPILILEGKENRKGTDASIQVKVQAGSFQASQGAPEASEVGSAPQEETSLKAAASSMAALLANNPVDLSLLADDDLDLRVQQDFDRAVERRHVLLQQYALSAELIGAGSNAISATFYERVSPLVSAGGSISTSNGTLSAMSVLNDAERYPYFELARQAALSATQLGLTGAQNFASVPPKPVDRSDDPNNAGKGDNQ